MSRDLQARAANTVIRVITTLALVCMFIYVQHSDERDEQAARHAQVASK